MTYETFIENKLNEIDGYQRRGKISDTITYIEDFLNQLKTNIETMQATQDYINNSDQTEQDYFNGLISKINTYLEV
jgi:hypothetical protein